MSKILKQNAPDRQHRALHYDRGDLSLEWRNHRQAPYVIANGQNLGRTACLRCDNPPCLTFSNEELDIPLFGEFPSDRNDRCCPTGAIMWEDTPTPVVNPDLCIACGVCVRRCPAGAIYLTREMVATVSDEDTNAVAEEAANYEVISYSRSRFHFSKAKRIGSSAEVNDELMSHIYERISNVSEVLSSQPGNILVRNLLLVLELQCGIRRRGDTNIRMDMVLSSLAGQAGTGEIELGTAILDAPRNILDNVAVLISRYHFCKEELLTLVVTLSLPRKRSEYWKVLQDIEKIVGLRIGTISVGALVALVYSNGSLRDISPGMLYYHRDSYSIRDVLDSMGIDHTGISHGHLDVFECQK